MSAFVFDIECDSLLQDVTKIHCLSYTSSKELAVTTIYDYEEIKQFFLQPDLTIIGHNIVTYDVCAVEKILGIKIEARLVDTLGISFYLNSSNGRQKHGLEQYGKEQGNLKKEVTDWENLSKEDYKERCEGDVKINFNLWKEQQEYLMELYDRDVNEVLRLIGYITFKQDCIREQNENRIPVNIDLMVDEILRLEKIVVEKREALAEVLPDVIKYRTVTKPAKMEKADGSTTVAGEKWYELIKEYNCEPDVTEIEVVASKEKANPDSTSQIKNWLYSFGWVPRHIKFERNKQTNEVKQIPQITNENDKTEICESIVELSEQIPEVSHLAGYSTVKHRLTILKGFLRDMDDDNRLVADALGYTNTMRLKHRVLVNLPKPTAPYAESIRACLIAGEGNYMVGADLKGIEDALKRLSIYDLDREYVEEMQNDDFDAHTSVAVEAGLMTKEEEVFFKKVDRTEDKSIFNETELKEFKRLKTVRQDAKTVNFSATYNVGAKTLARNMKKTEKQAKSILDAYWKKNKAVKEFTNSVVTKTVRGQLWLQQPVSKLWYTLRGERDKFSTCNQGSAVFVFDMWVRHVREQGLQIAGQFHDEIILIVKDSYPKEKVKEILYNAIDKVNEHLDSPVKMGCSVDYGLNYKEVH